MSQDVKELVKQHEFGSHGFFNRCQWAIACKPFVIPGKGYWRNDHNIRLFRPSTDEDFDTVTPAPMPEFIRRNPWTRVKPKDAFGRQVKSYHLCKKVAVSFGGNIYRGTDAEIDAALKYVKNAPKCDAATCVKAVREVCRRHAVRTSYLLSGAGKIKAVK